MTRIIYSLPCKRDKELCSSCLKGRFILKIDRFNKNKFWLGCSNFPKCRYKLSGNRVVENNYPEEKRKEMIERVLRRQEY